MLNLIVKDAVPFSRYARLMETLGSRIKQLRQARGYTQLRLATELGVTKSAVSQWELDATANIKLPQFLELCRKLGTDPYYFVFGNDREPADPSNAPSRRAR